MPRASATAAPTVSPISSREAAPSSRASWSGLLQFGLVAIPVKGFPVTGSARAIAFNQLHADCGQRIRYEKHCPAHGKVDAAAIVRGYQYAPDQYVVIDDAELNQLRPARDKALSLQQFVDTRAIDPRLFSGRALYLVPDGLAARRPYAVLLHVMRQRQSWALGRVVLGTNRQFVLVRPAENLLILDVLYFPEELRGCPRCAGDTPSVDLSEEELRLADMLIDTASGPPDWARFRDETTAELTALIEAKVAGRPLSMPTEEPAAILPLVEALKKSVQAAQTQPSVRKYRTRRSSKGGHSHDEIADSAHARHRRRAL